MSKTSGTAVWGGTRIRVYERDGYTCVYCRRECVAHIAGLPGPTGDLYPIATIDHIIPKCRGGSNRFENLVTACARCNSQKGWKTADEYRAWLAARVAA